MRGSVIVTLALLVASPIARADGIGIPAEMACPEGSSLDASHGAIYCELEACTSDATCGEARRCEERRVCTRGLTYSEGSRTWPPPPGFDPEHHVSVVMETCAVQGACAGEVEAATRTTGALDPGPAACAVQRVCVAAPPAPPSAPPAERAPPSGATPPPEPSGCAAGGRREGSFFAVMVLVLAALRRARA